jgi:hypothetical protein
VYPMDFYGKDGLGRTTEKDVGVSVGVGAVEVKS